MIYTFVVRIGSKPYEIRELELASDEIAIAAGPDVTQAIVDKSPPTIVAPSTAAVGIARGPMLFDDAMLGEWRWAAEDDLWEWQPSSDD